MKHQRDEQLYELFKEELFLLSKEAEKEIIDLYYFDATGLNLKPNVPYAWQLKGMTHVLPSERSLGKTILGLFSPYHQDFQGAIFEGSATAACVVKVLEDFSNHINKKTVVVLDNASIHKATIVKEKMAQWRKKGLYLQFIPAYCPELNLIEILWKNLKHFWLKIHHYQSIETLQKAASYILSQYGNSYRISFE